MIWTRLGALSLLALPISAQTIRTIDFYEPKRESTAEFRAAITDYNTALRKAGGTDWATMWSSLSGPSQYVWIQDYEKWADLDKPRIGPQNNVELAVADQRIRNANQSTRRVILRLVPEASVPLTDELPTMIYARWARASSAHSAEYGAILKSDLLPAVKKGGIKSYSVWQVRLGTEMPQYLLLAGIDNWAFFDRPSSLTNSMKQEAVAKMSDLTTDAREDVYRLRPELSYLPAKK
jgi:hypothetical protein